LSQSHLPGVPIPKRRWVVTVTAGFSREVGGETPLYVERITRTRPEIVEADTSDEAATIGSETATAAIGTPEAQAEELGASVTVWKVAVKEAP
jgi:hypothetical protein